MKIRLALVLALLLVAGLVVGRAVHRDHPDAALLRAPHYVHDHKDRAAVLDGFYDVWLRNQQLPFDWSGDVDRCDPGSVSEQTQAATLSQINYFRALAGLLPVGLQEDLDPVAQRTALMMEANRALSHDPPTGWSCRTPAGAQLAGRSNLALGSAGRGAQAITQYVLDPGRHNKQVGHRRWLFNPRTARMATGSTAFANAVAVVGMPQHDRRVPRYVPWPSKGFFPAPLEPNGRWSLSAGRHQLDFGRARVRVIGPGRERVRVRRMDVVDGMGPNTLVWKMKGLRPPKAGTVDRYRVRVTRIRKGRRIVDPVRYTVRLVAPDRAVRNVEPPDLAGTFEPGRTVYAYKGTWSPTPREYTYQWLRDGEPIRGETRPYYQLAAADAGRSIGVRVSAEAAHYAAGRAVTERRVGR